VSFACARQKTHAKEKNSNTNKENKGKTRMAKSKKKSKKNRTPNIPAATLVRPRLDRLFQQPPDPQKNNRLKDGLDEMAKMATSTELLLSALLSASLAAPANVQKRLNNVIPPWLQERGYLETLQTMLTNLEIDMDQESLAKDWLAAGGIDVENLEMPTAEDFFYKAFYLGNESQASLTIFWYTNHKRNRVQGLLFLIDYNPPWEGALKEGFLTAQRSPQDAVYDYIDQQREPGFPQPVEISMEEAKDRFITAMECNHTEEIRLHRDIASHRDSFIRYILPLPGQPDTPEYTAEDFDYLCAHGTPAEEYQAFEQRVGRRVRMEDGSELFYTADAVSEIMDGKL
jgi:hypothetical protein